MTPAVASRHATTPPVEKTQAGIVEKQQTGQKLRNSAHRRTTRSSHDRRERRGVAFCAQKSAYRHQAQNGTTGRES